MRILAFLVVLAALTLGAVAPLRMRTDPDGEARRAAAARALGIADLCLSASARWLRHPSLSEPGAAFHDLAGGLDSHPGGMSVAPPVPLYVGTLGTGGAIERRKRE